MQRKTVVIIIVLILLFGGAGVGVFFGLDCNTSCAGDTDTPPASESPGNDTIVVDPNYMPVFNGSLSFELKEENDVYYPTFSGELTASFIPDKFYLSFNEQLLEFPKSGCVYTYYAEACAIKFSEAVFYDYLNAGNYLATLYAVYEKENKTYLVGETQVVIEEYLFKADFLTLNNKKIVAMYTEDFVSEANFKASFELVDDGYMYPTLDLFMYLSKLPTKLVLELNEQIIEIDVSEFSVIKRYGYYELSLNKVILFDSIPKGANELVLKVMKNEEVVRRASISFNSEHDYYASSAVNAQTGEIIYAMDSDDFWIGPY